MKFCGNCGNSVPDDARACPYCGNMLTDAPAAAAPSKGMDAGSIFQKYKLWIIIAGVILALLICWFAFGQSLVFGTYKTPIKNHYAQLNSEKIDVEDTFINMYDGVGKSQLKDIYKILESSKNFKDWKDEQEDDWKDYHVDALEDEYGKGWEYDFEITDKDDLDEDDLKDIRKGVFKAEGDRLIDYGKDILDLENDQLKAMAERMGLKKDELKELANLLKELGKELKDVEPKKGYEVDVDWTIAGKDDDDDGDATFYVVKVGQRWVSTNNISAENLTDTIESFAGFGD